MLTRISMTKTMLANSERGAPRVSTVMFPGQSHISSGMSVLLEDVCEGGGVERRRWTHSKGCFVTRMVGSRKNVCFDDRFLNSTCKMDVLPLLQGHIVMFKHRSPDEMLNETFLYPREGPLTGVTGHVAVVLQV